MSTTTITISVLYATDWDCDYTAADQSAYEQTLADAIGQAYPGADVDVNAHDHSGDTKILVTTRTDGRIDASREASARDAEIEQTVRDIYQQVWDDGMFWASPAAEVQP